MVASPSQRAMGQPVDVSSHPRSTKGRANADRRAELAPMPPTTVKGSQPPSSRRRWALAITAKDAPAPIEPSRPQGSVPLAESAAPPIPSSTTPAVAAAVATIHVAEGVRRVRSHSSRPARIGAEPRATTVPTATPLRSVPRKKSG